MHCNHFPDEEIYNLITVSEFSVYKGVPCLVFLSALAVVYLQHIIMSAMLNLGESEAGGTTPTIEVPTIPSPITSMRPLSVDPGIEPQLQNIVSTVNLDCKLDLKKIALHARNVEYNPKRFAAHGSFSSYEPELFPGLIYRMVKPRIVLLVFVSGKVVLTGAKRRHEINEAFDNIYPILKKFKKQ
ncbi:hypothetical protein GWI33_008159 [Rhynchophorus ferrugineus]|uniref:TATA-box-binding protein n=1 Tax=Rhynchophorus ferrugineus TaxID=354439 RepID=A0A834IH33_RHYFE|nr:hypothetical protein GWI33_008159 [Rhynchophorus ferrugineus]